MILFLYLLAAMGVGYWAKLDGRHAGLWFAAAVVGKPRGATQPINVRGR
jgi:hypothetical protein